MVKRLTRFRQIQESESDSDVAENILQASGTRQAVKAAKSMRLFFERRRSMQVDDFLWFVCFAMTMFFLDVPRTVLFHHKIDW